MQQRARSRGDRGSSFGYRKFTDGRGGLGLRQRVLGRAAMAAKLESLDQRMMFAAITWTGNAADGGKWETPGNWDLNRKPGFGDVVTIGAGATVVLSTGSERAQDIDGAGTLNVTTGGYIY